MLRYTLLIVCLAGCERDTTFQCDPSRTDQCGVGRCESTQFCSFPSSDCPSMYRYGESSGPNSGECVGGSGDDGGMEGMGGEMPGQEMTVSNCPTGYMTLANSGPRMHMYKLASVPGTGANASWSAHRDQCVAEAQAAGKTIFLAFPDGTSVANAGMELAALRVLAGDDAWVGVNDLASDGNYVNSLNAPVSASTQGLISTSGNPNATDCLVINTTTLDDADCAQTKKAVCECVP